MGSAPIPFKAAPGLSPSKSKMTNELVTIADRNSHRCSFDITIEKKMVDGSPVTVCRMNKWSGYAGNGKSPLPEEFTNIDKFAQDIKNKIISIGSTL